MIWTIFIINLLMLAFLLLLFKHSGEAIKKNIMHRKIMEDYAKSLEEHDRVIKEYKKILGTGHWTSSLK